MLMEGTLEKIMDVVTVFGVKAVAAAAILLLGWWASKIARGSVVKILKRREADPMLVAFVGTITYVLLLTFVILASLGKLGVQTTSFVAVIGAAGLAVGLALQGALANFAAGVLMLVFKPFKEGDYIEGAGTSGSVEQIQIFTTKLKTPDNKLVIIPNAKLTSDNIVNYSAKDTRRVDMVFGIAYGDDIDKAKALIHEELAKDDRILKDPAPTVALVELADSSVNFVVRPWVNTADYWNVYFATHEAIKKRMDAEGIHIPFPQRDVHLYRHNEGSQPDA
jgi:small conductance mechanosensitive channel